MVEKTDIYLSNGNVVTVKKAYSDVLHVLKPSIGFVEFVDQYDHKVSVSPVHIVEIRSTRKD